MSTYKEQADAVIDFLNTLSKEHPGVAEGFGKLHSSSSEGGKMGSKHKELISLGVAICMGGGPSVVYGKKAYDAMEEFG